jgi:hypothetical protein
MLLEHIKNILLSEPLDIFSEEDETLSQSSFELVTARQKSDFEDYDYEDEDDDEDFEELSRYIGSANLFIAAAIVCDVTSNGKSINTLNNEELEIFNKKWKSLINQLKEERFIRELQPIAHSKIKLVVNNEGLPNIGA